MARWFAAFAGSLALFALLGQGTPHGTDTDFFVVWLENEPVVYARHPLYMTLARLVHEALAPLGVGPYAALLWLSALSSAIGVACSAAALGRLCGGGGAQRVCGARDADGPAPFSWLVLALLLVPAVFYFATAAEIGGVSFGAAGVAWLLFARWRGKAAIRGAVCTGLATGVAAGVHAFGHLLVPLFALAAWQLAPAVGAGASGAANGMAQRWRAWAALGGVHAAVAVLAAVVAGAGARGQATDAWGHLVERWATLAPAALPEVLWREWLVPFAPWSVAAVAGLFVRASRPWALVTSLGLLLHLPLTVLLLGSIGANEVGMYHLALAVPAVATTWTLVGAVARRPAVWFGGCLALGVGLAVALAAPKWPVPGSAGFAAGLRQLREEGAFTLVGTHEEVAAARMRVPRLVLLEQTRLTGTWLLAEQAGMSVEQWVQKLLADFAAPARPVLFTDAVVARLRALPPPLDAMWPVMERVAEVEPVARDGFRGTFVRPR